MRKADMPYYKNAGLLDGNKIVKNAMDTVNNAMPKMASMPANMPDQGRTMAAGAIAKAQGMADRIGANMSAKASSITNKAKGMMDKSIAAREGYGSQIGKRPTMPTRPTRPTRPARKPRNA